MSYVKTGLDPSVMVTVLAAHKALISDYALRARQAEDMASGLMSEHFRNNGDAVAAKIIAHQEARGVERATQYMGVIQATLMSLTELHRSTKYRDNPIHPALLDLVKALTLTTESAHG